MRPSAWLVPLFVLLLIPAGLTASHSVSVEQNGLRYFLATERDTYVTYEYVPMELSVTNITGDTLELLSPCTGIDMCIRLWDPVTPFYPESVVIWGSGCGCFTAITPHTLGPGESFAITPVWDMYNVPNGQPIWRTGTHTIDADFGMWDWEWEWLGYGLELEFDVLPGAASVPEVPATWGTIKALYR
ncbi:MAG: hypothetical protein ABIG03_01355 [Candidatus Eisenbacteria bacterium]